LELAVRGTGACKKEGLADVEAPVIFLWGFFP
jgi:hypothetical protein